MTLEDRLLVLEQGRARQLATSMVIFDRPTDIFGAGIIGAPAMNLLSVVLTAEGAAAELTTGVCIPFPNGPAWGRPGGR